jgi:hypothetical protein
MIKATGVDIRIMRGWNRVWDNLVGDWPQISRFYEQRNYQAVAHTVRQCYTFLSADYKGPYTDPTLIVYFS